MESPLDPNNLQSNIPPGYDGGILGEISKIVKEELDSLYGANIEITPIEPDERSPSKGDISYHVNYQKNVDGNLIEIEGVLKPYHTGRAVEYGFEPSYFDDANIEQYWDANWEAIEAEIRDKFYSQRY